MQACDNREPVAQPGKRVKIGVIGPFSGDNRKWGESGLFGVRTAINLAASIPGNPKIELVQGDDGNDAETAQEVFRKLVVEDGVSAVMMLSGSVAALGVAGLVDQYQTPVVSALSTHPSVTENNWMSQTVFDDRFQATVAAMFVIDELLVDRVGLIKNSNDPHYAFLADMFNEKFQEAGGETEIVDIGSGNAERAITELSRKGIEFVYLPVGVDDVAAFEQLSRAIGWHPQAMVSDGILALMLLGHTDEVQLVDGMLATDVYSIGVERTVYGDRVSSRFSALFDKPATTITALGCEAASILLRALQSCSDDFDKACINRELRSGQEFEGIFGPILIRDDGKTERPIFINRISNGELQYLFKVN